MSLGERIKALRRRAGLSQEQVAEQVGVSRQAVAKWEAGQSAPSTENLRKLVQVLQVGLEERPGSPPQPADPIKLGWAGPSEPACRAPCQWQGPTCSSLYWG